MAWLQQEVGCEYMDWTGLAQDRNRWRTLLSAVMNLRVPWNAGNFLTSCKPVSFSRRTLHHGVSKYGYNKVIPNLSRCIILRGLLPTINKIAEIHLGGPLNGDIFVHPQLLSSAICMHVNGSASQIQPWPLLTMTLLMRGPAILRTSKRFWVTNNHLPLSHPVTLSTHLLGLPIGLLLWPA